METVIGLNLNHNDTCLFTKTVGGEGLPALNKFLNETLRDALQLVALRLEDRKSLEPRKPPVVLLNFPEEYQYATTSAYSPTMSELPLRGNVKDQLSQFMFLTPISRAAVARRMAVQQSNRRSFALGPFRIRTDSSRHTRT